MSSKVYNNFFDEDIWKNVNEDNKNLLDDFLLELKQRQLSKGTIYQYKRDIMGVFCYIHNEFDNKYILSLTKRDLRKYSLFLTQECDVSNARHNRLLSSIRSMLSFAENEEDLYDYDRNIAEKVKGLPKDSVRDIIFLTDNQILNLVNKLVEIDEFQKATLIALAYDSCGRKNEICQVNKYSFLDSNSNSTNVVVGKGGKEFRLLYFDLTKKCAKLWLNYRGEDDIDSLWIVGTGGKVHSASNKNIYDWIISAREVLKYIEGEEILFNVHSMRHSSLQNYSDGSHYMCQKINDGEGFPIEKLKILANHSNISTTSDYLKDDSISELESMFDINIES
jgi:integrase/recombinase XerD